MAPLFSLQIRGRVVEFYQPAIMAVVNLTPDSFFDGGKLLTNSHNLDVILKRVEQLIDEGADIIDLGAESTRPGALPVSTEQQLDRIGNSIGAIKQRFDILVSVDTSDPQIIHAANHSQADIINDIRALQEDGALDAVAESDMALILMHMQGQPETMQNRPQYQQSVDIEVSAFLRHRLESCIQKEIALSRIAIDPGFGFGKTAEQNLQLLRRINTIEPLAGNHFPVLAGLSRKSMIEAITGSTVQHRLPESLALALIAVQNGAHMVRVHDVRETANVLSMWQAINHTD